MAIMQRASFCTETHGGFVGNIIQKEQVLNKSPTMLLRYSCALLTLTFLYL